MIRILVSVEAQLDSAGGQEEGQVLEDRSVQ